MKFTFDQINMKPVSDIAGNLVLWRHLSRAVNSNYIGLHVYTSTNENFKNGDPHSSALWRMLTVKIIGLKCWSIASCMASNEM